MSLHASWILRLKHHRHSRFGVNSCPCSKESNTPIKAYASVLCCFSFLLQFPETPVLRLATVINETKIFPQANP